MPVQNVCKEPTLQSLTRESMQHRSASIDNGARLDISGEGFWGHPYQCLVFDVRAFCLLSSTNRSQSFMACYRDNENACTPILVAMASPVLEILLLSNFGQISLSDHGQEVILMTSYTTCYNCQSDCTLLNTIGVLKKGETDWWLWQVV